MHSSILKFGSSATVRDITLKLGLTSISNNSESKSKGPCYFHDLIISPSPYKCLSDSHQNGPQCNPKTSFYLCKKYNSSLEFEQTPRLVMKRMAYRKKNKVDQRGSVLYNDPESKNYDQIATEFSCYSLLKDSYRCIRLIELLHENISSKEDKKIFYRGLKLPDKRSQDIKNVCFVLEQMNEGSLQDQIILIQKTKQPFSEEKIIEYSCQFAEGLLELKAKGIIHRDLRPENVLIHNGQIKFSDFDSAFIKGYSDYRNIKNGVYMKDTMPHEIMLLIAQSEDKLKTYSSDNLYELQEKADIYFLGVNIYSMVFSQSFESFNGNTILNNLIGIKKIQGFNYKILDLMARCLQKDPHVRISLDQAIRILVQIEQEYYLASQTYKRTYLSSQPLNLQSFSCHNLKETPILQNLEDDKINRDELDSLFQAQLKKGTLERSTPYYETLFKQKCQDIEVDKLWDSQKQKLFMMNQNILTNRVENFLERLQIKAYYYELVYKIFCEVNLASIPSCQHFEHIRAHSENFHHQLVILLTFLYKTLMKCSFTQDPHYDDSKSSYQVRQVTQNIKNLHSRWEFFSGRLNLHNQNIYFSKKIQEKIQEKKDQITDQTQLQQLQQIEESMKVTFQGIKRIQKLQNIINHLSSADYEDEQQRIHFSEEERNIIKCLDKMQALIKQQMIKTIVGLILAYEQIKKEKWGHRTNLKNTIFMIMILEAQNTRKLHKNDIVIIKDQLTTLIKLGLGWKSYELEAFFNNYIKNHPEQVIQGLIQLQSQAGLPKESEEDIRIQINGRHSGQFSSSIKQVEQQIKENKSEDKVIEAEKNQEESYKFITVQEYNSKNKNYVPVEQISQQKPQEKQIMRQTFDFKLFKTQIGQKKTSSPEEVPELRPNTSIESDRLDE